MLRKISSLFLTLITLFFITTANAQADSVESLFRHPGDPVVGNVNGKVTFVEFFDYACSHCANMVSIIDNLIKANPNVRFVFKELPIRGDESTYAARAALAANMQGKYFAFHDALFKTQQPLTESTILDIATKLGLDSTQLKNDMANDSISNEINFNLNLASSLKVPGTPAFFIGPTNAKKTSDIRYTPGEVSQSALQDAINEAAK